MSNDIEAERKNLIERLRAHADMCHGETTWGEAADCIESILTERAALAAPDHIGDANEKVAAPALSDNQLFRMASQIRELPWTGVHYPDLLRSLRGIQAENSPQAAPALSDEVDSAICSLLNHIEDQLNDEQFSLIHEDKWNAVSALLAKVRT